MKTILEQVKDDYAGEQGRDSWSEFITWNDLCNTSILSMQYHHDEVAKRYAIEVAKEALKNASLGDGCTFSDGERYVHHELVISETNIPKI